MTDQLVSVNEVIAIGLLRAVLDESAIYRSRLPTEELRQRIQHFLEGLGPHAQAESEQGGVQHDGI